MMTSRYGIFCLILFLAVLGLGVKNYETWSQSASAVTKRETPKKPEPRTDPPPTAFPPMGALPREAYKSIAEKNIFHPERQEFPTAAGGQVISSARPPVALQGIVVSRDYQSATIVSPGKTQVKGEREAKTVKPGDRIGEYQVAKIKEDRIILDSGEDSFEVLLYDPSAPKKRTEVKTPAPPVRVTSSVGAPSPAPGTPPPPPSAPVPRTPIPPPAQALRPTAQTPQPAPQAGTSGSPGQEAAGPSLQTQSAPSATSPGAGIWRGRRPFQPVNPATPEGN